MREANLQIDPWPADRWPGFACGGVRALHSFSGQKKEESQKEKEEEA